VRVLGRVIRTAHIADARGIQAIFAPLVAATAISFEIEPPSVAQIEERIRSALPRFRILYASQTRRSSVTPMPELTASGPLTDGPST
jgi:L-amino acid N-acyltransferase YncA